MKKYYLQYLLFGLSVAFSVFLSACSDDGMTPEVPVAAQDGYFIINEGAFGNANTTLSYYDRLQDSVINNIFSSVNGRPLGDQTQSMSVFNDLGFILVQNSAKIEVINRDDFTSVATMGTEEGIVSPRYFLGINNDKAYVSDWGMGGTNFTVKVIDLNTYEVIKNIPTGQCANKLALQGNQVYVANSGGYNKPDSTVMVINTQTDAVTDTLVVGDNPSSLVVDANGNIWVAGGGNVVYNDDWSVNEAESTPGFIAKITNNEVALKMEAPEVSSGPGNLVINSDGSTLYFTYAGGVYEMSINDTAFPTTPLIEKNFYGLGVDPLTGEILGGEVPNYNDNGTFYRYTSSGELIDSYMVGIAPNGFAF